MIIELSSSDWIAVGSAVISFIALAVALYSIRRSNRNSSVATLVTLNEGFGQAWVRYLKAESKADQEHEFFELLNLIEIACAIHCEKSFFGVSRELSCEYTEQILLLLERDAGARQRLESAIHSPTTLKYTRRFRSKMRKRNPTLPLENAPTNPIPST